MSRATSPSSVVTNPTVTRAFALRCPSIRVSGFSTKARFCAGLPRMLRDTVTLTEVSSTTVPENVCDACGAVVACCAVAGCTTGTLPHIHAINVSFAMAAHTLRIICN